ncbi:caspase family protein [Streptomyces sp. NPDC050400]|uniref:caspase family protein n=1 Tax=Streptomyces sp. NPDC050400 TaxID=3365610 RepID=UPI00379FE1AC
MAAARGDRTLRTPRRFLLATAVTEVAAHPELARPELVDDVRRMERLFLHELGYERGADLGLDPTREQLTKALREFATDPERAPGDYVALYIATHGVTDDDGSHYLLTADSTLRDPYGTALPTEQLVGQLWQGAAAVERLLVLVDSCYAEEGTDHALRTALDARRFRTAEPGHGSTGLVLVASSRRKEEAYTGALSAAFDRAVRRRATAGNAPPYIGIPQVMAAIQADPEVPQAQQPVWSLPKAVGDIPAFLPNHRHIPGVADRPLEEIDRVIALGSRERRARQEELRGFFLPRARGTDVPTEMVWDFTGRHTALTDLTHWLAPYRAAERLCVVTGDPGSGKSSVLGMVGVLSDPELRDSVPRTGLPGTLPVAGAVAPPVNAAHKSTRQLLDALSAAAGSAAETLGALTVHLQTRTRPLVVLIDSLDEALDPQQAVAELIAPLADPERRLPLRLLVGARPHVARRLPASSLTVDLDAERYADPSAVRAYVRRLLDMPGTPLARAAPEHVDATADAIAEAAGRSFLVARITACTVAREPQAPDPDDPAWRDALPRLPGEAMERDLDQRLGPLADRARDLLRPLAYAQGAGLPWAGVWPRLASELSGRAYSDDDIVWLRRAAGSYVVEGIEDGGSVYRVYHRALIEYLRESAVASRVQSTITRALRGIDHPYVRRYLALHAAEGGVLDPMVQDARFVLSADAEQLLAALPRLRTEDGRRAARAVRDVEALLRDRLADPDDPEARARLRLAAVCRKADALAGSCDRGDGALPWRVRWAAWNAQGGERRYDGLGGSLDWGIVVPGVGGAQFLEKRYGRREAGVWDLDTGELNTLADDSLWVNGYTLTAPPQLPGHVVVLEQETHFRFDFYGDGPTERWRVLHLWDVRALTRCTWRLPPHPLVDHDDWRGLAREAQVVVVPDLPGGPPARAVLRFPGGARLDYALTARGSLPAMSKRRLRELPSYEREKRERWQRQQAAECVQAVNRDPRLTAMAARRDVAGGLLTGHEDGTVRTEPDGRVIRTGHHGAVERIEHAVGHPAGGLLVTAGVDRTLRLSSLVTGKPVRTLLDTGYIVESFAVHRVGQQWIVAVSTGEGALHRIDLDSGRPVGLPLRIDSTFVTRVATFGLGTVPCVSVQSRGQGLQLYDLVTGDRIGGTVPLHEATAVARAGGIVAVGGSDGVVRQWPGARAADTHQVTAHEDSVLALGEVRGPGGAPALLSVGRGGDVRCWDTRTPRELWHTGTGQPAPSCATVGRTADGRDLVVTADLGGGVRVRELTAGLPVAERQFRVEGPVTAVTTGRVRGWDMIVAVTAHGRIACWDTTRRQWAAVGLDRGARATWTTALALDPHGTGRLLVGRDDGMVEEWTVPECRPRGEPRALHRGGVRALGFLGRQAFSTGYDHRVVAVGGDWETRMPFPVGVLAPGADGALLCGDDDGQVWQLTGTAAHWQVTEALDAVPPVSALAFVTDEAGRTGLVTGCSDSSVQVRDGADGILRHRLRPVCESGVAELVTAAWRSPGRAPRRLCFARSELGVLEYWDFSAPGGPRRTGTPLRTPVPHHRDGPLWLRTLPEPGGGGGESVLSFAVWDDRSTTNVAVHDVARGPLADLPCYDHDVAPGCHDVGVLRAGDRTVLAVPVRTHGLVLLDQDTGHRVRLPDRGVRAVELLAPQDEDPARRLLLIIGEARTRAVPWAAVDLVFRKQEGAPPAVRRAPVPRLDDGELRSHRAALRAPRYAVVCTGGHTYAVASGRTLALVGVEDGTVRARVTLPSACRSLAAGPQGELAVGTRNGVLLFDPLHPTL